MTATAPAPIAGAAYATSRWRRVRGPALVLGGLGLATLALHVRDPHESGSWGFCPSAALGIYCPGCGGLRAVNDLTNADLGAAASSNLLFVALLPLLVFLLGRWALDRWTGRVRVPDARRTQVFLVGAGIVALAFTVLRNVAAGSWLAP
ncbi:MULTISPECIES: DUF2752 domain-containing protein [unclassified Nocardioides]|uniref:DUF2752 domain-containing protein n=1 Tax=unclassified Nocardioides TaxID=2615069 RepID=UPI00361597A0